MATYMPDPKVGSVIKIRTSDDRYPTSQGWMADIRDWAQAHRIRIVWLANSTRIADGRRWHESLWTISDPRARTMFLLRWGS